jgi:rubredoxin-NAD+ reductase
MYNSGSLLIKKYWEQSMALQKWVCNICGYEYDEEKGDPDHGIEPGTRWEDVPDDWECPECGAKKSEFEMVSV